MLKRKQIIEDISHDMSVLQLYISNLVKQGKTDVNLYCEDLFLGLLNRLYDIQLKNMNNIEYNYPAIDLGDENSGVSFQITSTNNVSKIINTLDKYNEKELYKKYNEINILILGNKKKYSKKISYDNFCFDKKTNIKDIKDLLLEISQLKSISKLTCLKDYLKEELNDNGITFGNSYLSNIKSYKVKEAKNYTRFISNYMDINEKEECETIIKDMHYFGELLENLDENTREYIKVIIDIREVYLNRINKRKNNSVKFNRTKLEKKLNLEPYIFDKEFELLYKNGYLEPIEYSYEEFDEISMYSEYNDWDILYYVVDFCFEYKIGIEKVLLDLDFTIFDNESI